MWKMQAMRIAQRMPSKHKLAISESSQSCSPTLNAAKNGVQHNCKWEQVPGHRQLYTKLPSISLHVHIFPSITPSYVNVSMCPANASKWIVQTEPHTLNMGLTCSWCMADVKLATTWEQLSISAFEVADMCSISEWYKIRRCFSVVIRLVSLTCRNQEASIEALKFNERYSPHRQTNNSLI